MTGPICLPLAHWRLLFSAEQGRDVSTAETLELIRQNNARYPEEPGPTYADLERDSSEAIARWWRE
jgi:hypothetical protein